MGVTIDSMDSESDRRQVAREAKAIVALAFRNRPIENIHAGRPCPTCSGQAGYSRITDAEMKAIMRSAVNKIYALLFVKLPGHEVFRVSSLTVVSDVGDRE